ncbi:synaptotagmin-16-like isoform X2 [Paramormyrops kingsleyae]|uniref:synaptotagmin-16-like isoform X2 n=1 Tax=Paramormyrops kingsleyae TaxID=1676925 RepID=UPI003B97B415
MPSDITPEAIGFLSAVGVFVVLLAVLLLFINRKLCFSRVGGLPCLEQHSKRRRGQKKGGVHLGLVDSFGEDDDLTTSSDSGDEVMKQFEISVPRSQSSHTGLTETCPMAAIETCPTDSCPPAEQRRGGREASNSREGARGRPRPPDGESCPDNEPGPLWAQDPVEGLELEVRRTSVRNPDSGPEWRASEVGLEMETAVDNLGYDHREVPQNVWNERHDVQRVRYKPPHVQRPVSTCGEVITLLEYKGRAQRLLVTVMEVQGVENLEAEAWLVRLVLLPSRRRRHKTGAQRGPLPCFGETFRFSHVEPTELERSALRLRLYAVGGAARERLVGQGLMHLCGLKLEGKMEVSLTLEARSHMESVPTRQSPSAASQSDSASSSQSLSHSAGPELLLGLAYNAVTGRLSVELIKGSHFGSLGINRPPDTYGKLTLLDTVGQELCRCKTSLRRGQPHPVYKETFVFQVALFQLSDVTLLVSIYSRRSIKRKELLGWVSLGHNASGREEWLHWQDMRQSQGQQVCRWHGLQEA